MKIAVVGLGYVGLSNAVLLAQHNKVVATDISQTRVNAVNARCSPIKDPELEDFLSTKALNLSATTDPELAYSDADFVVVATPTNYDPETNYFDTSSVENVISAVLQLNPRATIIVKSTIPVGFIRGIRKRLETKRVIFSPEFLREGRALYDNLHPSRIIIGDESEDARLFSELLLQGAVKKDVDILFTGSDEAEAIKLFSNTYLAMRVAYFNELDSYAMNGKLNTRQIIDGVGLDPRIGRHYNNPSFGYGGYCLPKDTKQLLANFSQVPQNLIGAIIDSNHTRKKFLANQIITKKPKTVGVYRLVMKAGSDNYRNSSVLEIMKHLVNDGIDILVYEPVITEHKFLEYRVEKDLVAFKEEANIILANRITEEINDVMEKVFSRDLFESDI